MDYDGVFLLISAWLARGKCEMFFANTINSYWGFK
jgi:hypothetical protein